MELNNIDSLLKEMVAKYERQKNSLEDDIKHGLRMKEDKKILLQKLKQKRIVVHYMGKVRDRINLIMEKRFQIESLNITAMQVNALRHTASVFKDFNKVNNLDKIEKLQETMVELTDQVIEINETLGSEPLIDIDEEELLTELNELNTETFTPISTIEMPMVTQNGEISPRHSPMQQQKSLLVAL